MPNQKIFCGSPWYELHIYWDGSLGICCAEDHKLYAGNDYNIATTSIAEWFNSPPVQQFRQSVLGNNPVSACRKCYVEEQSGGHSRRFKNLQKSAIFGQAFEASFAQSPIQKYITTTGTTTSHPIDIHVDLGNFCNLACKMCGPQASSMIASQQVRWGIESSRQYLGTDWTKNEAVWQSFLHQLLEIPSLNNIHFMGGETLLTNRFEQLVDFMTANQRFDLCFSFVTNGTVMQPALMDKLTKFRRVGIEVSIETVDEHNAYQRQGTDTKLVLANIDRYQTWCNEDNITITVRPALSALTIGYYPSLLEFCLDRKFVVKSLLVTRPVFLDAKVLPSTVKKIYSEKYQQLADQLSQIIIPQDYNASDPNHSAINVKEEVLMCLNLLATPELPNSDALLADMVQHCRRWDQVYGFDARQLYPELMAVWDQHGY